MGMWGIVSQLDSRCHSSSPKVPQTWLDSMWMIPKTTIHHVCFYYPCKQALEILLNFLQFTLTVKFSKTQIHSPNQCDDFIPNTTILTDDISLNTNPHTTQNSFKQSRINTQLLILGTQNNLGFRPSVPLLAAAVNPDHGAPNYPHL